jgi:hypothetical protein
MLSQIAVYEDVVTLIQGSGIQFLDFAFKINANREPMGEFVRQGEDGPLARLMYDEYAQISFHPASRGVEVRAHFEVPIHESIRLLKNLWLPIPFLRSTKPGSFEEGPSNWARMRIVETKEGEDQDGNTHRITLAFDTKAFDRRPDTAYLAPTNEDIRVGGVFDLAHKANEMSWFLDLDWVDGWLKEIFLEQTELLDKKRDPDEVEAELNELYHQAHYLNVLNLVATKLFIPKLLIVSNQPDDTHHAIPVDMVLDIGNSRSCGILIEDHPQQNDGLSKRYPLELRDLTMSEFTYRDPFESRIEFAEPVFGKDHFSMQSGRSDVFRWPTITRIGPEALRLASLRRGTEGSTGLSSPKRYLWDEESYEPGWRFNCTNSVTVSEPHATAVPLSGLINDRGQALFDLPEEERMPVFHPHYSRSSLMTFMLAEVLTQALTQMNNPAQRLRMSHSRVPRHLRSINLTVPPSMAKPEREIFAKCMEQAIGLIWKSFGWDSTDDKIDLHDPESRKSTWPFMPEVFVQWDEATCGQAVYLFNEVHKNFAGRPEEFFATMRRPGQARKGCLTIASIDIGGGTTDLVITDFRLDGTGSNVSITPTQLFRDGFRVAGDDILLDVIRQFIIPALNDALTDAGVDSPESLLSRLIGNETLAVREAVLRQQLTLQVFNPLGLRLLKEYEEYNPLEPKVHVSGTFGELLGDKQPTEHLLQYFSAVVNRLVGGDSKFDLLATPLDINLRRIQEAFIGDRMNICKTIQALCEVVYSYPCDVLLLTGRPSRLPGIQALFHKLLPLPPGRIQPLNHYRTGGWYPFNKQGCIEDPKTTAAVGAMICLLSRNGRIHNYALRSAMFRPYSTLKHLGFIDNNNVVKDENVYYRDIDLDNPDYELPESTFEMRAGLMRLGFRQLANDRWSAAPLFVLSIEDQKWREKVSNGLVLNIELGIKKSRRDGKTNESFYLRSVESEDGPVPRKFVNLKLNTLSDAGLGETQYWLDSGSVFLK